MVDINGLTRCHFLASSTTNPESKLQKLFSYHLPSLKDHKGYLNKLKKNKLIGNLSSINYVTEENVDEALAIANGQNINCEPSAIAGLALLLQMRNYVNPKSKILIVSTGSTIYKPALPTN
jgi:threonine synthase